MISLKINGSTFLVKSNISVLEACKFVGIEVSRFCYHELLSISGNCRMCLVELDKSPKPVASCVTLVIPGMQVFVSTPFVKKAREVVVEMLLINHPLDCPICDQGGECDLQDQVKLVGSDFNKFCFNKKVVEDKSCGPLIKTIMTRCIHCTRCVRYSSEVAGIESFGTLGRGKGTEIGFYSSKYFYSEISGNIVDLCPVGALTSKPYAFKARPWELGSVDTIDLTDGLGSSVSVDIKKTEVLRVLPKKNTSVNESLISDKARYSYDSLILNRSSAILKDQTQIDWSTLLKENEVNVNSLFLVDGSSLSLENLIFFKSLCCLIQKDSFSRLRLIKTKFNSNFYLSDNNGLQATLNSINSYCLVLSSNLRLENTLINIQIRNKFLKKNLKIFEVGLRHNSVVLPSRIISLNINCILKLLAGKNSEVSNFLAVIKGLVVVTGESLDLRFLSFELLKSTFLKINPSIKFLKINLSANTEGCLFSGVSFVSKKDLKVAKKIFLINLTDTIFIRKILFSLSTQRVFWLNPWRVSLRNITYSIPTNSSCEENGVFINLEKRPQKHLQSVFGFSKSLSQIFSEVFCVVLKIKKKNYSYVKFFFEIIKNQKNFKNLEITNSNVLYLQNNFQTTLNFFYPFKSIIEDFYNTNIETKNSVLMSKCSQEFRKNSNNFE